MKYNVKVTVKEIYSEKEKYDRITRFQQAFVLAAVDYYSDKQKKNTKDEQSA